VKQIKHYRKTVIARCKDLRYLDDRPVFEEERRRVNVITIYIYIYSKSINILTDDVYIYNIVGLVQSMARIEWPN
jgi:hypothetical protein